MFDSFENGSGGGIQRPARIFGAGPTFSKVFRWRAADVQQRNPASVELAGSFTDWQRRPFTHDERTDTWQLTLTDIPGHHTHRYTLLIDGVPAQDKNCDGLAVPEGDLEQGYQISTTRGPRVCLLFAQTK